MSKVLEAVTRGLSEEQAKEISAAVAEMLEETNSKLEVEFNKELENAYASLAEEVKKTEDEGYQGYREAWEIITDLRNRLESQRAEYSASLDEGYEEAFQALAAEKGKNEALEAQLREQKEKEVKELEENYVNLINTFLKEKGSEIYSQARRDLVNDPAMIEHKLAFEKIVETVGDYITDEEKILSTNSKLSETTKALQDAQHKVQMLESKNTKLSRENTQLNEQVSDAKKVISEAQKTVVAADKKERTELAKNASGRGKISEGKTVEVISENVTKKNDNDTTLAETYDPALLQQMRILAGTDKKRS